jgi:hypothetical protein
VVQELETLFERTIDDYLYDNQQMLLELFRGVLKEGPISLVDDAPLVLP